MTDNSISQCDENQCDECEGAGEICSVCGDFPDNCDCEGSAEPDWPWIECPECEGDGVVEEEEED